MWITSTEGPFDQYFQESLGLLAPLLEPPRNADRRSLFEFVCCLVHPSGVEGLDENPLLETTALIEDLVALASRELLAENFDEPHRT